ncbi:MAG: ATP-binding cassette domain-containing protein [Shimia sp.]
MKRSGGAPLIALEAVGLRHGAVRALHGVDLEVARGEILTIVGPNGSGKSSLLRLMLGEIAPTEGRVTRAPGLRIGYVPQSLALDRAMPMTAGRFLALAGRGEAPRRDADVAQALAAAGAGDLADRQLSALSGGQRQRVLLARAALGAPDVLMLDEPTQGLDQSGSAALYAEVAGLRDRTGCAVVMVSHELHVVMSASDRVVCVNGHICCSGTPEVVAHAPEYRALFGTGTKGALALYRHEHGHAHD